MKPSRKTLAALALFGGMLMAEFTLEPRESYVPAKTRIPGFEAARRPEEGFLFAPVPDSWKVTPLDGRWRVLLATHEAAVDYLAIDEHFGPVKIADLFAQGDAYPGLISFPVPWSLSFQKQADGTVKEFRGFGYYTREFEVPAFGKDQALFLCFEGAGWRTDAWVDGQYLGSHQGPFASFEFDLSKAVKPGAKARLVVKTLHTRYGLSYLGDLDVGIIAPVRLMVRDALHAKNVRVKPDFANGSLQVRFVASNPARLPAAPVSATVEGPRGERLGSFKGNLPLAGEPIFSIPLANPQPWSPENPALLTLKLYLGGHPAAVVRFGWRSLEIKAGEDGRQHFMLNGQRLYARGFEFDTCWNFRKAARALPIEEGGWGYNRAGWLREALLVMKFANVNVLRPHSMNNFHGETFYRLCDELGFLVNLDWNGSQYHFSPVQKGQRGQDHRIESLEKTLPSFREVLARLHNHPSLGFISFGNELYDWELSPGRTYDPVLTQYYEAQKAGDLWNRPASGSSGRPVYAGRAPVDFVDHHQYIGVYYGSWQEVRRYLRETRSMIQDRFGAALPFVNYETGDVADFRVHAANFLEWAPDLRKDVFDKALFIRNVQDKSDIKAWARLAFNTGGLRPYLCALPEYRARKSDLMVKRYLELFRVNRDLTDGVSLNTMSFTLASVVDPDYRSGTGGPRVQPWPDGSDLVLTDPVYRFRAAFSPVQAFLDLEHAHPIAGQTVKASLVLVNDSEKGASFDLSLQWRGPDGKARAPWVKGGFSLAAGAHLRQAFPIEVPADLTSGKQVLEVYLSSAGVKISENSYDFYMLSPRDRRTRFPAKKVAVYDLVASRFAGFGMASTKGMLEQLGIPHDLITNFERLAEYPVLLIGANSFDAGLMKSGEALHRWLLAGGRLAVFEQTTGSAVPWSPEDRITVLGKSSFVEHWYPKHPLFRGIENEMAWESPAGRNGALFDTCLELNDSFLSVAAVAHFQDASSAVKAVITDRRLGKGEYLLSMIGTAERFGKDGTITRYVENLLDYLLGDEISPYAVPAKNTGFLAQKVIALAKEDAEFVDLRAAVNRGFADEKAADGEGGWTDYGRDSDMRAIPLGVTPLSGLVPFTVIDPSRNGGRSCLVLRGPTREAFPAEGPKIAVGRKFEKLFFLHTFMYVKASANEPIVEYLMTYDDGKTERFPVKKGVDGGDWWQAKDLPNGATVYRDGDKGLYASEWVNPNPKKAIASIQAFATGKAIPILIAVTGKKKFAQTIDKEE
ncbi:MAG: hypothetical protein J0L75_07375 [Spirochaetes bacterium]|nr:hypothetical protein [Spirochaetota bacterium]